jgi:hypothetical protein
LVFCYSVVKYTADEIRKMEESIRIRRSKEPTLILQLVKKLKHEVSTAESSTELSPNVKHKLVDEILQRLKSFEDKSNVTQLREVVETWRNEKLEEAKELIQGQNGVNSTLIVEEAGMLVRALELEWDVLSEEIGFWLPAEVTNVEHDDKPEGEEEPEEILAGRPVPAVCNAELHTDYGGAAVRWGLTHHKESAADCCQACLDQAKRAKPGETRCNIWVYCPSEFGCFSPDIYEHKHQECWLKYVRTYLVHILLYPIFSFLEITRPSWTGSLAHIQYVYVNCRQRSQNRISKTDILRHTETTTQKRHLSFHGFQVL